jgi:uncharacterized membrane protein
MKIKLDRWMMVVIFISIIITGVIYNRLPDQVPIHWNIAGEIDDYGSRYFVWFTALLPLMMIGFMNVIPKIDPKKESYKKHKKAYEKVIIVLSLFFIILHWMSITAALGYAVPVGMIVSKMVGKLFIIMGNYMGQIRPNYTFGIKTPWTLADETVWKKTHRVGGIAFIIAGFVFIMTGIINNEYGFWISFIFTMGIVVYMFLYSYWQFYKLHKE